MSRLLQLDPALLLSVSLLASSPAIVAQRGPTGEKRQPPVITPWRQQAGNTNAQRKGGDAKNRRQENHPHPGKWLQEHNNLPPQDQEKALERDPDYQKLSPQRQEQLKERLRRFNSMSPQQRQRTIERMQAIEQLPPEKREMLQNSMAQLRNLSPDRRQTVRKAYRNLREMSPEERNRVINSDRFKNMLDDNERSIVNGLLQSGVDISSGTNPGPNGGNQPKK